MNPRRILITGATGGLGAALVREAQARGHEVRATGRDRNAGARLGVDFVPFDLTDPTADLAPLVEGVDSVIHAAALSASWGRPADFEAANIVATRRLLDAAAQAGAGRFIFISSPSIFAAFRDRAGIGADDAAARPLNHYARTKRHAERVVLGHAGPARVVIRPRALVGPGDRVILPRLAALARRERMPLPRGGRALIELTDLRDAARVVCEAEARAPLLDGAAINISGGRQIAVRELASRLADALGTTPRLVSVPMAIAGPLARLLETVARLTGARDEPVLTRYTLATLAYSQTFDPEPARRLLGFAPRHDAVETLLAEARRMAR